MSVERAEQARSASRFKRGDMSKVSWGVAVAAVVVTLVLSKFTAVFYHRAEAFEEKARIALGHEHVAQVLVDLANDRVKVLEGRLAEQHAETDSAERAVVVVDSISPPDTSCAPNLAARDDVIRSKTGEIATLQGIVDAQGESINLLQASKDELKRALEARPKLYPRFVGPSIGLGVSAGIVGLRENGKPSYGVVVGVTLNVFSVRF